jgi:hypothetical protein
VHLHAIVEHQLRAHLAEQLNKGGHIVQMRHVADRYWLVGQQA